MLNYNNSFELNRLHMAEMQHEKAGQRLTDTALQNQQGNWLSRLLGWSKTETRPVAPQSEVVPVFYLSPERRAEIIQQEWEVSTVCEPLPEKD